MSQIGREHILHTFARVFERNLNTEIVVLIVGRESILANPYKEADGGGV